MGFGEETRKLRLEKRIGLREFCKRINKDPSYWSKVERELTKVCWDGALEAALQDVLELSYNDLKRLYFYARFQALSYQARTFDDLRLMLPVFICTVNGKKPSNKQLKELAELIKDIK